MIFLHPIYLLLALPLGVALMVWGYRSRWLLGLRVLTLGLIVLALAGLALHLPSQAGTVVVVADRSRSMPVNSEEVQHEAVNLIMEAMNPEDRLAVVSFGQGVVIERPPQPQGKFAGFLGEVGNDASQLAEALEKAQTLISSGAPGRILVLSDGQWTGKEPGAVAAQLAQRGIALDYRAMQRSISGDTAIVRLDAPSTANPGESFLLHAWIQSPSRQEIAFNLRRGNQLLASGTRLIDPGINRLTFRDQAGNSGTQVYVLSVATKENDPVRENNTARLLVGVQGPRPLLVVPSSPSSRFADLLSAGGLQVKTVPADPRLFTLEELSNYAGVVLENVPADQIGHVGMETLAAWVQHSGSGLMLTGGRASYGPGGYFKSPLDPILPVSMELRQEHRKLSLAIVVALDRSGSMAMSVGGGKVKMDLANLGAVQVVDLLAPNDEFGCLAVDSAPHVIQNLAAVKDKGAVRSKILGINSQGGGIFIYEALEAAYGMLQGAKAGTRHIILFSDAADAEEPKAYQKLLEKCRADNITVSVIGLGKESDKDGALLKDIAIRGNGRIFFSDQPDELPRLFAQDTFVVARSAFLDEPTPIKTTAGLTTLVGKNFSPPDLGGYNLCYLRPTANLATVTLDDYNAPVVAAWQAGAGRVLCYTGEVDGKYTGAMAAWKDVGDFFTSLARWTTGRQAPLPQGMLLTQDLKKGVAHLQLHLAPDREQNPFSTLPEVTILRAMGNKKPRSEKAHLVWAGTDYLSAEIPLAGNETILATVDIPGHGPVSLSPLCLLYSPEFEPPFLEERSQQGNGPEPKEQTLSSFISGPSSLARLARITGGKERIELPSIWRDMVRSPRLLPLAPWLLVAAILVFLLEVLERLTALLTRGRSLLQPFKRTQETSTQPSPGVSSPLSAPSPSLANPVAPTPEPAKEQPGILAALREAQKRGRTRNPPS